MAKKKKATEIFDIIRLAERRDDNEEERVTVGVNGNVVRLQRDVLLPVTRAVTEVLRKAVIPRYKFMEEEDGGRQTQVGTIARYPFEAVFRDIPNEVFKVCVKISTTRKEPLTEEEVEGMVEDNLEFQAKMQAGKDAKNGKKDKLPEQVAAESGA